MRILKESFQNAPNWFKQNIDKNIINKLNKIGIDLYNCNVEEIDITSSRDPRFKDNSSYYCYLLQDSMKQRIYIPGINDDDYLLRDGKSFKNHSRKWLIDNAIKIGVINIESNKKKSKERYRDPRNDRNDRYAGQRHSDYSNSWYTSRGRDKSGYKIPDVSKLVGKLYSFDYADTDSYADTLQRYEKKIKSIKDKIDSIDLFDRNNFDVINSKYKRLQSYFGDVIINYLNLVKSLDNASKRLEKYGDKYETIGLDHLFYDSQMYKSDIDNDISICMSLLKDL